MNWFFWVTLLGATRSETSGGTPRDLLETRCWALQVLSWRFTEDFGCKFDADFVVQSFVAEFLVPIFQMGVRFFQKAPNRRIAQKKLNPKFEHLSQPRRKVLEGGWAVIGTPGGLRLALRWEPSRETRLPDLTAH